MSQTVAPALDVAIEVVRLGTGPEQVLEDLATRALSPGTQHLDALVLDADDWGLEKAVEWVRAFHGESLRQQAARAPKAWENALLPGADLAPGPVPPVLVVVASPDRLDEGRGDFEARLAGGGAVVYEKPADPWARAHLADHLRAALSEAYLRGWPDAPGTGEEPEPEAVPAPGGQPDLSPYVAPVYQLSDEDFEALLERGRSADPLATGE